MYFKITHIKNFTRLLVFSILSIFSSKLSASHMMGADISFDCLGNGKYHITMKIYRDCRGISFSGPTFGVKGTGTGCGQYSLTSTRIRIRDVTPTCSSVTGPCNPSNTWNTGQGIEEHTYEATVDFSTAPLKNLANNPNCCEVTFYVGQCCRNGAITTGPGSNNFMATAVLNLCNLRKMKDSCNKTPKLSNEPVAFVCCNQPYYFNNGAIDTTDFDSISYALVPGLQNQNGTTVNYTSPFSFTNPVTPFCIPPTIINCTPNPQLATPRGFFFDKTTGDIIYTPTKCDEVPVIVIEMTEWRKDTNGVYRWISKTRRDMQLWTTDCGPNKPPKITGSQNNEVCEGSLICFNIDGTDAMFTPGQTVPDTVQLKWNKGIPGATFTITNPNDREKTAQFCWQTKVGDAKPYAYQFTVTASDNHCPRPILSTKGFRVKVKPKAQDEREYTNLTCGRLAFRAILPAGFAGGGTFQWSFRDSNNQNQFYFTTKKNDTITFKKGGKFIVRHTVNNSSNCPTVYDDTIVVPDPPTAILATKDTFSCHNQSLTLTPKILHAKAPYRYYWTRPINHISGDTNVTLALPNVDKDSTIMVRITDGDGCIFYDTVLVNHKPLPVVDLGPDRRICDYESVTFDAGHADTVKYLWNMGDTTRTIVATAADDYTVSVTDLEWKCVNYDTVHLFVNQKVISNAGLDKIICFKDSIEISASHSPSALTPVYTWTNITTSNVLGNNTAYKVSPPNTNGNGNAAMYYYYELLTTVLEDTHACAAKDTMELRVNTLPKVRWLPLTPQCWNYGDIILNPFIQDPQDVNNITITSNKTPGIVAKNTLVNPNRWVFKTQMIDNNLLNKNGDHAETLTMTYTDTNGCTFSDSRIQTIKANPLVTLRDRVYCQDLGEANLDSSIVIPKSKLGTVQTWTILSSTNGVNTMFMLEQRGNSYWMKFGDPTEDFYSGDYKLQLCVRSTLSGCQTCKDTIVRIVPEPNITKLQPPPTCVTSDTIDLLNHFLVSGFKPELGDGNLSILQSPLGATNTTLLNGHLFNPGWGAGVWEFKFESQSTGCYRADSFMLNVVDTPNAILLPNRLMCENESILDLSTVIDYANSRDVTGTGIWSGPFTSGGFFTPTSNKTSNIEGPHMIKLEMTNAQGCVDTEYYQIRIRTLPQVSITNSKPGALCAGDVYNLNADPNFDNGIVWSLIQGADGNFSSPNGTTTDYNHGTADATNRYAWVKVTTIPETTEVCPQASDSMQIIIHPYPVIAIQPQIRECMPYTASFTSTESEGIDTASLNYVWDLGNGESAFVANPTGILYSNQGIYNVNLTVTNTAGNCATSISEPGMVEIYPNPTAIFSTDPTKTTIALPKFQMVNTSTVPTDVFPNGTLSYMWNFNDPKNGGKDTSTFKNPYYGYRDTGWFRINLLVTTDKGCTDTMSKAVYVGPDITIFIPDVFSPNGFGPNANNTFIPIADNFKAFSMIIFNRWGQKMYETDDITKPWDGNYDGEQAQQGVYAYYIELTSFNDKVYKFEGTVTLIR